MKVYSYSPDTGEYTGPATADESPLEPGVFLIPAYATAIEPPSVSKNEIQVFVDGGWIAKKIDAEGETVAPPSPSDVVMGQIAEIERTITQRRLREAVLTDSGKKWLLEQDAAISALRAKL